MCARVFAQLPQKLKSTFFDIFYVNFSVYLLHHYIAISGIWSYSIIPANYFLSVTKGVRSFKPGTSGGMGTRNPGEMGWRHVEQGFFSFFANFLPHLMIFQSGACGRCCRTLKNHQIMQKFGENEEKPWSTCLQLIFRNRPADSVYPKIGFRVAVPPLISTRHGAPYYKIF